MSGDDIIITRENAKQIVVRAIEQYESVKKFLEGMDARSAKEKEDESLEAIESYEAAVHEYELLHEILGVKTPPRWCT